MGENISACLWAFELPPHNLITSGFILRFIHGIYSSIIWKTDVAEDQRLCTASSVRQEILHRFYLH